ncbi:MAG: 3-dehydroquinate synthase [Elusimicrobiales bacterium]|nr:3-dehydroquinate synthase [Elusimicrobiales bacterium]
MRSLIIKIEKKTEIFITEKIENTLINRYFRKRNFLICDEKTENFLNLKVNEVLKLKSNKKDESVLKIIMNFFFENKIDRNALIIILGGGKISDVSAFVCSIWMRGIDYVIVPTTLLSQIDASVGGKTAIDWMGIRNIIGSFYFPSGIIINPTFALKQNNNAYLQAMGEIFKYIIITDINTSKQLYNMIPKIILRDKTSLSECIKKCIDFKISVVQKDPFDCKGIRETLNFGHTTAHAIESLYKTPHGDSVFYGCIFELMLSKELGYLKNSLLESYLSITKIYTPKLKIKLKDFYKFYQIISYDKKNRTTKNTFLIKTNNGIKRVFNIEVNILKKLWRKLCEQKFL